MRTITTGRLRGNARVVPTLPVQHRRLIPASGTARGHFVAQRKFERWSLSGTRGNRQTAQSIRGHPPATRNRVR